MNIRGGDVQLTRKSDYAIRIVLYLAKINRYANSSEISNVLKVPKRFTLIILAELLQHGVVVSQKGAAGGYAFAKPDSSLLDVVNIASSEIAINKCLCEAAECERIDKQKCAVHLVLADLNALILSELDKLKIVDIAPEFLLD